MENVLERSEWRKWYKVNGEGGNFWSLVGFQLVLSEKAVKRNVVYSRSE